MRHEKPVLYLNTDLYLASFAPKCYANQQTVMFIKSSVFIQRDRYLKLVSI